MKHIFLQFFILPILLLSAFFTLSPYAQADISSDFVSIQEVLPRQTAAIIPNTNPVQYSATLKFKAYNVPSNGLTIKASLKNADGICCGTASQALPKTTVVTGYEFSETFEGLAAGTSFDIQFQNSDGSNINPQYIIQPITTPGDDRPGYSVEDLGFNYNTECSNGIDDDGDTTIDMSDKDCESPADTNESACEEGDGGYCLLAPLPGIGDEKGRVDIASGIGSYLLGIIRFIIALCGVLAVFMIVVAGIQYMSTDAVSGKEGAKEKISHSIFGLIIALGAYIILNTINPQLVNFDTNIKEVIVEVDIAGDTNAPVTSLGGYIPTGVSCPGNGGQSILSIIATSFSGKTTYELGGKGAQGPNNTILLDCSGYVNKALQCAGLPYKNVGTSDLFKGAEVVSSLTNTTANGKTLQPGDLVGWTAGTNGQKYGHVYIYLGSGKFAESHGPSYSKDQSVSGKGIAIHDIESSKHRDDIKYVKRIGTVASTDPFSTNNILSGGSGTSTTSMAPNITNITSTSATLSGTLTGTYKNGTGVGYKLQKLPIPPLAIGIVIPLSPDTLGAYSASLTPLVSKATYQVDIIYKASTSSQEQILGTKLFTTQ